MTSIALKSANGHAPVLSLREVRLPGECADIWSRVEFPPAWDLSATPAAVRTWISYFGQERVTLLELAAGGETLGVFPVRRLTRSRFGVNFRVLTSLRNEHWSAPYPMLSGEPEPAASTLLEGLRRTSDWDLLEIGPMLVECPLVAQLIVQGEERRLAPVVCHREEDWRVRIAGTWQDYYAGRNRRLRKEVDRGERRLADLGAVTFEFSDGRPDIRKSFADFCQVEASGWKGQAGTAVACDPVSHGFHEFLVTSSPVRDSVRFVFLRLNGRVIAAAISLLDGGVLYGIKMGRDEALAECSLGHVLLKRTLQHLFGSDEAGAFDMMIGGGAHSAYKARWANESRTYVVLRFFNPRTIRGALAARFLSPKSQPASIQAPDV
jgi:hypothetical protein